MNGIFLRKTKKYYMFLFSLLSTTIIASSQENLIEFSYEINDSSLNWTYSNCNILNSRLYFSDYTDTLKLLISENYELSLTYMNEIVNLEVICPKTIHFKNIYRGNLIFIIETLVGSNKFHRVIEYSTSNNYICNFSEFSTLEIIEKNRSILFKGNHERYEVFDHGDISNTKGSLGNLFHYLCGRYLEAHSWVENCKSPSEIVGKKISSNKNSCILEGKKLSNNRDLQGKCIYYNEGVLQFLVFTNSDVKTKIRGISGQDILIRIGEEVYKLKKNIKDSRKYVELDIPKINAIGKKFDLIVGNKSFFCVVGMYPQIVFKSDSNKHYGAAIISSLISLVVFTLFAYDLKTRRRLNRISA